MKPWLWPFSTVMRLSPNHSAVEGPEERWSAVVEDMLRMAKTLFPKALEFVTKTFAAGDLSYRVAGKISRVQTQRSVGRDLYRWP
jgi:hypothetical protein